MSVLIFHTERFWIKILKVGEVLFVYSCLNQFEQPLLYVGFSFIKQNKQKKHPQFWRQREWIHTLQRWKNSDTKLLNSYLKSKQNEWAFSESTRELYLWNRLRNKLPYVVVIRAITICCNTIWTDTHCDESCSLKSKVRVNTFKSGFSFCQVCHWI